jgi:hypothetical protein
VADQDIREAVAQTGLRMLCTGSRDWRDWAAIQRRLVYWISGPGPITVIHGAQVSEDKKTGEKWGADYFVDQLARQMGAVVDPHPADWKLLGKQAGRVRNQIMVDLNKIEPIHVCLAWPLGRSPGTRDCMRRAALARIPIMNYGDRL